MNMGIYEKIFWARVEGDDELADRLYTKAKKEEEDYMAYLLSDELELEYKELQQKLTD